MIKPSEFIHPSDAAALRQMESIPGFPTLVKKFLALGFEQLQYGLNMATAVRLSPTQLPELYNHLPPICQKLGIEEPEFYLQMDPMPNAYTFGDTKIYITITSGLVELLNDEELDSVIAPECGHILCRHVLYHSIARYILMGVDSIGIFSFLTVPLQLAILHWSRMSELSCDRCASIISSPDVVASTMARLSGGPKSITSKINMEEWAKQADKYDEIKNDGLWNKTLQLGITLGQSHPFSAVRVREILQWKESQQFKNLMHNLGGNTSSSKLCPVCNKPVNEGWRFCNHCGAKL